MHGRNKESLVLKGIQKKFALIRRVYRDEYPTPPRPHSLVEKIVCTIATVAQMLSLGNIKDSLKKDGQAHWFMDVYVIVWGCVLVLVLFLGDSTGAAIATTIACYRIFDVVSYRIFFLFVKSQEQPWQTDRVRRSVVIATANLFETIVAFAIIYSVNPLIAHGNNAPSPLAVGESVYFSLVTMLTVGYGDYAPAGQYGRFAVSAQLVCIVWFGIFLLPALVSLLSQRASSETPHSS